MPLSIETRRRALAVLIAVEGGLILLGAALIGITGQMLSPLDAVVGADASIAAIVLGAGLILAYRHPAKIWVNLAIMYNALTVVAQLWKGTQFQQQTSSATIVSIVFLVLFLALYPRGESMEMTPQH